MKSLTKKKFGQDATNVGDEGGFAPNILVNSDALDLIVEAIKVAGYTGKIGEFLGENNYLIPDVFLKYPEYYRETSLHQLSIQFDRYLVYQLSKVLLLLSENRLNFSH